MTEHMDECVRQSFGEWGAKRAAQLGIEDPKLPGFMYFWECHPWCPVLLEELSVGSSLIAKALNE